MYRTRILVVDDDENILFAFREVFKKDNINSLEAANAQSALDIIQNEQPEIVFLDINMPNMSGLELLNIIREKNYTVPVIIMTGQGTMQTAIQSMKAGAFQYILKPISVSIIREEISKALATVRSVNTATDRIEHDYSSRDQLIGNSLVMHELYKNIGTVSTTSNHTTVLITGETGTGKELVARAIHNYGSNYQEPFISINCTAIPETLLESELFGHEKGSFTGATETKIGKFEAAGSGSIFLDEVGDLSPALQNKLLRALQEREFERIGSFEKIPISARFIAATNQNLEERIKDQRFRKDLFFRLNIAQIRTPALRDHKEDIPILANYFLKKFNHRSNKNISEISQEGMELLIKYDWPGNVRELENIIERSVMRTRGSVILHEALNDINMEITPDYRQLPIVSDDFSMARDHLINLFEKQFLSAKLKEHGGNISAASKASNMSRQNFHRLIIKHELNAETNNEE
jgi:DNA-binding NtrC family response regulator